MVADKRQTVDVWEDAIATYLGGLDETSIPAILEACLAKPKERWTRGDQTRVGVVLTRLGWTVRQLRIGGAQQRRYFKPGYDSVTAMRHNQDAASMAGCDKVVTAKNLTNSTLSQLSQLSQPNIV